MKLFKHIIYGVAGAAFLCSSCKIDNYPAPTAGIQGAIIDAGTGKQVPTEQPNGINIDFRETKYGTNATPNDFWCKADGSFENTNLFAGQYKIIANQGAFFPITDTAVVNVSGITTVNFKVVPYLNITATVTAVKGGVQTSYTISRQKVGDKINFAGTIVSAFPSVSNTINEFSSTHDLNGTADDTVLATPYSDTVTGLTSGSTYYVRVEARTANAYNRFNYSQTVQVVIP